MARSSTRERQLARARQMRRQARQAARRRRRRQLTVIVAGVVVAVLVLATVLTIVVAGGGSGAKHQAAGATPTPTPTPAATPRPVACGAGAPSAGAPKSFPSAPPLTIDTHGAYVMHLQTSCGALDIALHADKAPQTVNALSFLAGQGYYDGTPCHRMTTTASLTVLQCGDPTGTGSGSPGFTLPEENLAGATYPRGTVAMAKTSAAHSTGSQFFLVDRDATLPPQYTPVGSITAGLDVLDKIIKIGTDDASGAGDGAPLQRVFLEKVIVTKR